MPYVFGALVDCGERGRAAGTIRSLIMQQSLCSDMKAEKRQAGRVFYFGRIGAQDVERCALLHRDVVLEGR